MTRLTILTLALTAAVASSAAPLKPAKKSPAPKRPVEAELPTIEVGKAPSSNAPPAASTTSPAKPAPTAKSAPAKPSTTEVKPPKPIVQKLDPVAVQSGKESRASKQQADQSAIEVARPKSSNSQAVEAAAPTAPAKAGKGSPAPRKPADIDLPAIEVGIQETSTRPSPTAVKRPVSPVKSVQKAPAPEPATKTPKTTVEKVSPKPPMPAAPRTVIVAPMTAPLKPVVKAPAPKKPASTPSKSNENKAPQAATVRPAPAVQRPSQPPAPKVEGPTAYTLSAPIDLAAMVREGRATFTSSKVVGGKLDHLSDPNRSTQVTCLAMSTSPAYWQITLDRPRLLDAADLSFGDGGPYQWTLHGANSSAELVSRQGSYRLIVPARSVEADDQVVFPMSADPLPPLRVYRLEAKPAAGAGEVRLSALALWTHQELKRIDVDAMIPRVGVGSRLPLKALATFDLGGRQNMTPDVTWEVSPPDAGKVDSLVRLEGKAPGKAIVTAIFKDTRSNPLAVDVIADGKPDWTVTYIERGPRVPIDGPQPKIGQKVVWFAHVKNYGSAEAPQMAAEWRVDGKKLVGTTVAKLDRFQETDVMLPLVWDGKRHHVELVVDPANQIAEESEANNSLSVATDALAVGMWVEESVVRYFHQKQRDLGVGSNGWEDWAQRQVASWNKFQSQAAGLFQPTPDAGVRWRIDRLLIVGDGLLPMAGGSPERDPDRREQSVHLMLGFPAVDPARSPYRQTSKATPDNPFFMQRNLLRSLTRAVYPQPVPAPPAPMQAAGG